MMKLFLIRLSLLGLLLTTALASNKTVVAGKRENTLKEPEYSYRIISSYPHDKGAFTQGLIFHGGYLYESTGLYGHASLRKVELETGRIVEQYRLPPHLFAEGLTLFGKRLIQLTWKSRLAFVYNIGDFQLKQTFLYPREGWGLTHDQKHIIASDGSSKLYFLDPRTLKKIRHVTVSGQQGDVTRLNELEYIEGLVYANVWQSHRIVQIDPDTGQVMGWINLEGILKGISETKDGDSTVGVLNGIAYDPTSKRLFVTGKRWPRIFEIALIPGSKGPQTVQGNKISR